MEDQLAREGILIRSSSLCGVAEEAPGAYKDVGAVVDAADAAAVRCSGLLAGNSCSDESTNVAHFPEKSARWNS